MKISKPIQYMIVIGGILAIALILWNVYSNSQEESTPEVASSPLPVKPKASAAVAKASPTPASATKPAQAPASSVTKASTANTLQAPVTSTAKASANSVAKASTAPAAKAGSTATTTKAVPPGTLEFRKAINKATDAAELTQTAKTKAQWSIVATDWQQAINFLKAVPQTHPKYQIAQQRAVMYENNLKYSQEASKLAQ